MLAHTTLAWSMKCFGYVYYAGIKGEVTWSFSQCECLLHGYLNGLHSQLKEINGRLNGHGWSLSIEFKWRTNGLHAWQFMATLGMCKRT